MNKLTCKDFKEILNESGIDFINLEWSGILMIIAESFFQKADRLERNGFPIHAEANRERGIKIFELLDEKMFKEVK